MNEPFSEFQKKFDGRSTWMLDQLDLVPGKIKDSEPIADKKLAKFIVNEDKREWPPEGIDFLEMLEHGYYSPLQPLAERIAIETMDATALEYPYPISWLSRLLGLLSLAVGEEEAKDEEIFVISTSTENTVPEEFTDLGPSFRRILQEVLAIREQHEERRRKTIEVVIPTLGETLPFEKLANFGQNFGRGIATIGIPNLENMPENVRGRVENVFQSHEGAPQSLSYNLDTTYGHLETDQMSINVRADSHLTISLFENPIVEYYNGQWHLVDQKSGKQALRKLLDTIFSDQITATTSYYEELMSLTYYLATHWHGAIVAIVEESEIDGLFQKQISGVDFVAHHLEAVTGGKIRINSQGLGRALSTAAMQDGAIVFTPDGHYHSSGRMLKQAPTNFVSNGGSGASAAKAIGRHGLAVKISQDGTIRVFASRKSETETDEKGVPLIESLVPEEGLFLH